eukprot:278273_1
MFHQHHSNGNTDINVNYGFIGNTTNYDNIFNSNRNMFDYQHGLGKQYGQTPNGYHDITVNHIDPNVFNSNCTPGCYHNITVNDIANNINEPNKQTMTRMVIHLHQ